MIIDPESDCKMDPVFQREAKVCTPPTAYQSAINSKLAGKSGLALMVECTMVITENEALYYHYLKKGS